MSHVAGSRLFVFADKLGLRPSQYQEDEMLTVYEIDGLRPVVAPSAYVHPSAILIGDVWIGPDCYIGPAACLRGDFGRLIVEGGSNVQDTCVMHGFPATDTIVEENGHIGHGAILHGCRVGRNGLVGMNAVVMDAAELGESVIVAASSFVKSGFVAPARTLIAGVPAKVVRELGDEEAAWKRRGTATYQQLARRCMATMKAVAPLTEASPDRPRLSMPDVVSLSEAKKAAR